MKLTRRCEKKDEARDQSKLKLTIRTWREPYSMCSMRQYGLFSAWCRCILSCFDWADGITIDTSDTTRHATACCTWLTRSSFSFSWWSTCSNWAFSPISLKRHCRWWHLCQIVFEHRSWMWNYVLKTSFINVYAQNAMIHAVSRMSIIVLLGIIPRKIPENRRIGVQEYLAFSCQVWYSNFEYPCMITTSQGPLIFLNNTCDLYYLVPVGIAIAWFFLIKKRNPVQIPLRCSLATPNILYTNKI